MERTPTKHRPPQISLILRALCGAYLIYLAWDLRGAAAGALRGEENLLFLPAAVVFLVVGALLCFFSIRALIRGEYRLPYESDDDDEGDEPPAGAS